MRLALLVLLASCSKEGSPELSLYGTTVLPSSGQSIRLAVSAIDPTGGPGAGEVRLSAPAGLVVPASVALVEGLASFEVRCDRCGTGGTVSAAWSGRIATKVLSAPASPVAPGAVPPVEAPTRPTTPARPDAERPTFSCGDWDGGARAGYTHPDGSPLAVGCDGERIDVVFIESDSPTKISVCGTIELAEPALDPVYLRAEMGGALRFQGTMKMCCGDFRCLERPTHVRYRFDAEPGGWVTLGGGARTWDYRYSMFGFWKAGQEPLLLDAGTLRNVDFFVGRGKRQGDP